MSILHKYQIRIFERKSLSGLRTYISSKTKQMLERTLNSLSDKSADKVSNYMTRLKRRLNGKFAFNPLGIRLLRIIDFVIVRTNGGRFIEFELSNICNARCIFCPYPDMLRTDKKFMHMSSGTLESIKTRLSRFNGSLVSFTPTTGDTLLHPEWNSFIREVLNSQFIGRATMFTNAIELDKEAAERFIELQKSNNGWKFSQMYFSLGAYDSKNYKSLFQVDRFEKVRSNIDHFLRRLMEEKIAIGMHFHVKLTSDVQPDEQLARQIYNRTAYPFVYVSHSSLYFSNEAYRRNALIEYLPSDGKDMSKPCAYLDKTRFAADGNVWADGCVISEMPGDHSLMLGRIEDDFKSLDEKRQALKTNWSEKGILPRPCQGCTMYRPCK